MDFDFNELFAQLRTSATNVRDLEESATEVALPGLNDFTGFLEKQQVIGRGQSDVFSANWVNMPKGINPPDVVIKVIRAPLILSDSERNEKQRRWKRELTVWQALRSEYIAPLVGIVTLSPADHVPAIVSVRMRNGTVPDFIKANPNVDRLPILLGIARGILYLHSFTPCVYHGDIKAINVLVDMSGIPKIIDFGISWMIQDASLWHTNTVNPRGTLRWLAPEYIIGNQVVASEKGDVYAYAMTCLEISTGKIPFAHCLRDGAVFEAIRKGERPAKPVLASPLNNLWQMWQMCWANDPASRPVMAEIVDSMQNICASTALRTSLPSSVSRAPVAKALIVSIVYKGQQYDFEDDELNLGQWMMEQDGRHETARLMRNLLMEKYGYSSHSIQMLLEGSKHGDPPTKAQIMRKLEVLVEDARDDDRFVFCFSGRASREAKMHDPHEADGLDDFLIPIDHDHVRNVITDDEIYQSLISPIESKDVQLSMIFDCCSSSTMLDLLEHGYESSSHSNNEAPRSSYTSYGVPIKSPQVLFARQRSKRASVVCWSACVDSEVGLDKIKFNNEALGKPLVDYLSDNSETTYGEMLDSIRQMMLEESEKRQTALQREGSRRFAACERLQLSSLNPLNLDRKVAF